MAPGYSQVGIAGCNCETTRFDVDEFGRVWYPNQLLFRVQVVDTNGNPITHFGGYGNAESQGPKSSIPDPEIGFTWLVGVGVTDKYIYMGDSHNRRLLRAKIKYAADETVDVPAHTAQAESLLKGNITDPEKVWQHVTAKDLDTRLASLITYGRVTDQKGIKKLALFLSKAEDPDEIRAAEAAVKRAIARYTFPASELIPLIKGSSAGGWKSIIRILSRIGGKDAVEAAANWMNDKRIFKVYT